MSATEPFSAPPERPALDPYDRVGTTTLSRWGKTIQFALLAFGALVAIRFAMSFFPPAGPAPVSHPADPADPANGLKPSVVYSAATEESVAPWVSKETKIARAHELETAKLLQHEFLERASELTKYLADWQTELDRWVAEIEPLLKNAAGQKLAANQDACHRFDAIFRTERPGKSRLDWVRDEMAPRINSVRLASDDPESALRPDADLSQRLAAFTAEARDAGAAWRRAREQITALVATAGGAGAPVGPSLDAALADQHAKDRLAAAETIRVATEQAQREAVAQEAAAKAEAIRIAGGVKARQIIADAEANRSAQDVAEQRQRQQAELERRQAALDHDLPEVKRYLAPFIVKGYAQPNGYFAAQTATAGPMSYSKIVSAGALKESRDGMQLLVNYATRGNDRDRAGFPTCDGSEYQWAELNKDYVRRAQELLKLYGDLLVERGLLAP